MYQNPTITPESLDGPPRTSHIPQQWELFGSPGHVLLSRINALRFESKKPVIVLCCALALIPLGIGASKMTGDAIGKLTGGAAGYIVKLFTPSPPKETPAPNSQSFGPVMNNNPDFDLAMLPDLTADVEPAMAAQMLLFTDKKPITECNFTAKVTDAWFDGLDVTPKCRYSKDKDRLWVWAYVKAGEKHGPFAGLLMRRDGKVTYSNIASDTFKLAGFETINPELIPRTMVADFPELLIKQEDKK